VVTALLPSNVGALPAVGPGGGRGGAVDAFHPPHLDFFRRWCRCEVVVERAGVRLLHVLVEDAAHDDGLMAAEAAADADLIALANRAVWLRALAVHLDLAPLAGTLGFRARLEQTRHVEPDVETEAFQIHVGD